MSSAAAREARKKAILGRGGDRLSKLTTAARGEDHPVYSNTDISSRNAPTTETFVGEESIMPTPPVRASPTPEPPRAVKPASSNQPSPWTNEHQQELLRALMSAPDTNRTTSGTLNPFDTNNAPSELGAGDDPMSAMLSALSQMSGGPGQAAPEVTEAVPRSLFSKLRPLLHLLASWTLLAFFAFVMEPQAHEAASGSFASSTWNRWSELAKRSAKQPFGVQPIPFFWAFVTLQLVLHSIQIFTKSDPIHPPTLLAMALPSLPPAWRTLTTNLLVYARMLGMLLDDIAGLVVGIGILIWISAWSTSGQ
ncbi:hypothetical protein ACEPAI_1237 [Sanghuangporus weigelae]